MLKPSDSTLVQMVHFIQEDIPKNRLPIFLIGIFSFLALFIAIPLALLLAIGYFYYADLPVVDHSLISVAWDSKQFLIPFDLVLLFLILIAHEPKRMRDKKYKAFLIYAWIGFFISVGISCLPLLIDNRLSTGTLYGVSFLITMYFITQAYYRSHYRSIFVYTDDYLGLYKGLMDDPFTFRDDINRAKMSLDMYQSGLSLIVFLYERMTRAIIFFFAVRDEEAIIESAKLFLYMNEIDKSEQLHIIMA